MEKLHKEIDLIQNCINRMANNSFLLKGWLVSVIVVVVALSPKEIDKFVVALVLVTAIFTFWYLDAYYLRTEKLYRKMYEWVIEKRSQGNEEFLYDLNPHRFDNTVENLWKIMFSTTLKEFYGTVFSVVLLVILYYSWPFIQKVICKC